MKLPTFGNNQYLYAVNRHRQHWLVELEKRKAFRYAIAIFTCIAVIVLSWIVRP